MQDFLLAIFIDPNPNAFTIPFIDISVRWYGILFTLGFFLGYFTVEKAFFRLIEATKTLYKRDIASSTHFQKALKTLGFPSSIDYPSLNQKLESESIQSRNDLVRLFPKSLIPTKELSSFFIDRLLWFVIAGCIIGARLGHVLFYDLPYYMQYPLEVFNLRAGGLASHGGTLGILLAVFLYTRIYKLKFPEINFLRLLDFIVIPTALVAFFIRLGNFINQEILGSPTDLPWGVIFGHPAEGGGLIARHPVQLYEGLFYLFTFFLLNALKNRFKDGRLTGLFFILIFGSRFLLEIFKEPQSQVLNENLLLAGQLLSIPFILLGLVLLLRPSNRQSTPNLIK